MMTVSYGRPSVSSLPKSYVFSRCTKSLSIRPRRETDFRNNRSVIPYHRIPIMHGKEDRDRFLVEANQEEMEAPLVPGVDSEREIDYKKAILLFLFPAIGGLLFGYEIGATSGAIDSIKSATKSGTDWYDLTAFQEGLVVSSSLLGGMIGSTAAAFAGSKLGRKKELLLASVLYGVGTILAGTANGFLALCGGRWIYGTGVGLAMHGAPSYIAETAPSSLRGLFISLKEGFIVFGILLGYFISYLFVDVEGGWRGNYAVATPLIILFGVGMLFLPDSPRFQLLSGDMEAAQESFRQVFGNIENVEDVVEKEMAVAQSVITTDSSTEKPSLDLFNRKYWKPLYITLSLVSFQQATGQPSVLYYAQEIFEKAEIFSDSSDASTAAIAMGTWKLLVTFFAASKVESLGRRPLLLYGVTGLTTALVVLSATSVADGLAASWTGVFALLLYVGCYQVSFGPVTWLLVGELYPLEIRNQGVALCTFANFGSNFIISLLFPVLEASIGLSSEYLVFALIGVVSVVSIYNTVPETKGKTLEEIEALFST